MLKKILALFLTWRILLFGIAFAAGNVIKTFGSTFPYSDKVLTITRLPNWIWGFGNFDGVHYLRIAQDGYAAQYSQAFFPLFPILIRVFNIFPKTPLLDTSVYVDPSYFLSGIILTNLLFFITLLIFYKLLRLDYNNKISFLSVVLLMVFPTSFYFGAIYTESLFLLLTVSSLYLIRKKQFLIAAILISLASMTKVIGVLLIVVYLIELWELHKAKRRAKAPAIAVKHKALQGLIGLIISPLGLLGYMLYLQINFGDAFYFLTSQPVFGAQRNSGSIVLLPQVIFRYIKIFTSVPINSLPYFNAVLEFSFTMVPLILLIYFFRKVRFSYWLFTTFALLLPTLTGTFSSMPRYSLIIFLLFPEVVGRWEKKIKFVFTFLVILGIVLVSLFIRGYWVA